MISKLIQAGADRAVSPYTMAGRRIVNLALRPGVIEFIDAALTPGGMAFTMEEVEAVADGHLAGQTIGQLRQLGILTLAMLHAPGDYEPNPPDERVVAPGEHLIVSGASDVLDSLARSSFSDSRSWQPDVKRA